MTRFKMAITSRRLSPDRRKLLRALRPCLILLLLWCSCPAGMHPPAGVSSAWASGHRTAPSAAERVSFESLDLDPATGKPVTIHALLFTPEHADARRLPAVVGLHGCSGMYRTAKSRREMLTAHYQAVADLLVAEGYAALFPDSFRSRGFEEICTDERKKRKITHRQRLKDAQGALAWLQRRDDVRPDRIALLGWSHGGSTGLAALNARDPAVADWRKREPSTPYFRAGAVFYPGCSDSLKARGGYAIAAPLAFFIGGSDDWTAPGPCVNLAARLTAAGEAATITVYPDAHHGFDAPSAALRRRPEVPGGVNPGAGVTVGGNPAARDDAYAKLKGHLRRHLAAEDRRDPEEAVVAAVSYTEILQSWKTAEDISRWMEANFSYDMPRALRLSETQRAKQASPPIYAPAELFEKKAGVCVDLTRFAVETLRHIDPQTDPKYLMIEFEPMQIQGETMRLHWLASFQRGGKTWLFADSKRPGHVAGPYEDTQTFLSDYEQFRGRKIVSFRELASYQKQKKTKALKQSAPGKP